MAGYDVVGPLGAGGMGEVYRAKDTRLGRDLAIKLLPDAFARDAERLGRFEREARLLASLNHSNIAHVYGFESATLPDGTAAHFLAMELVEGEDLAARLARGPVPIDEALAVARQIAEGLEEAHEKGIVHRDLKPANVKLTPDGKVKVLDFGLAKALTGELGPASSPDLSQSPTLAHAGTAAGIILGTAAYMSPEQARGKAVDKRTDIWAFGVVLFEMLTGQRLFAGETVSDVLAAVLTRDADWAALPAATPPGVARLLRRCLERDPRQRLRDIGDARQEIDEALRPGQATATLPSPPRRRVLAALPWAATALVALALVALWAIRSRAHANGSTPPRRFAIDLPWRSVPNWTDFDVALSPDGARLAWYGRRDDGNEVEAYVRGLDNLEAVPLADAREAEGMAFSPDGEWLALLDSHGVRKVSTRGGPAQRLAGLGHADTLGISWGPENTLLLGAASGLLRLPTSGAAPEQLTRVDAAHGETGHADPFHLPGSQLALMTILRGRETQLALVDLARRTYRPLSIAGSHAVYLASGHIAFRQGASVLAARFDPASPDTVGEAVPVLERVRRGPYVAADGTMLYVPERGDSNARLVWVDRTGHATPIPGERLDYSHLSLGSGGRQALLNIWPEVYVRDIEQGTRRLLTSSGAFPVWSRDGRWATYTSASGDRTAIVRQPADGSAAAEELVVANEIVVPTSWNARTGELAYFDAASDIWMLPPGGTARRFLATPSNERSGRFSPDGRWLAYVSDETGTYQVYVVPYPGPGPKLAVSVDGGLEPVWSTDGRELFFRRGGRVLAASLTFTPALAASQPVELFSGPYTLDLMGHQRWDVAPDGRFLMVENSDDFRSVLVQNWAQELTRLVPRDAKH